MANFISKVMGYVTFVVAFTYIVIIPWAWDHIKIFFKRK